MTEQETVKNLIMSGKAAKNRADGGEAVQAPVFGDMPRNKQFGYLHQRCQHHYVQSRHSRAHRSPRVGARSIYYP